MTTSIKHPFQSAKADGGDASLVRPSSWNAAHPPYLSKTNKSGSSASQYAVVVTDSANNDAFTTTTTASDPRPVFIVQDASIADAATGNVYGAGWDTTVNVAGNVTRGNWLVTSTTVGRAKDSGVASTSPAPSGTFAVATSSYGGGGNGTVTAYLCGGGTPPQTKTIQITRDATAASGNVSYTGVGFTPKLLHFTWARSGNTAGHGIGFSSGTTGYSIASDGSVWLATSYAIDFLISSGVTEQQATVASMDADGFTLSWVKVGSPTGTITINVAAVG